MSERPYELIQTPDGMVARVRLRGSSVLSSPLINRGTAFTPQERHALGLTGMLPGAVSTMEGQLRRTYAQYSRQPDDLNKNVYLANLRDRNEILFYRLLTEHIQEMLPIVYTPTIGNAIGVLATSSAAPAGCSCPWTLSRPWRCRFATSGWARPTSTSSSRPTPRASSALATGAWAGSRSPSRKLAVYIAAAGIHPRRVIPVVLDMGTDNLALLNDEMYLGSRHARVRDQRYDDLIDAYVTTATKLFPNAMLHWEDFGVSNAQRILNKYADQICVQR